MTVVTAIKTGVAGSCVDQLYKQMKIHGVMTHAEVVDFLYRNVRALYEIEQTLEILAARGLIENAGIPGTTAYRVKK